MKKPTCIKRIKNSKDIGWISPSGYLQKYLNKLKVCLFNFVTHTLNYLCSPFGHQLLKCYPWGVGRVCTFYMLLLIIIYLHCYSLLVYFSLKDHLISLPFVILKCTLAASCFPDLADANDILYRVTDVKLAVYSLTLSITLRQTFTVSAVEPNL